MMKKNSLGKFVKKSVQEADTIEKIKVKDSIVNDAGI